MLKFRKRVHGYVMIMVAFLIPVILAAVNYGIKRVQKSHGSAIGKSAAYAAAQAAIDKYNPAKTWDSQKKAVYSAAAQALNDRAFDLEKDMCLAATAVPVYLAASPTVVSAASLVQMYKTLSSCGLKSNTAIISKHSAYGALVCDEDPLTDVVFDPDTDQISYKLFSLSGSTVAYRVVCCDPEAVAPVKETPQPKVPSDQKNGKEAESLPIKLNSEKLELTVNTADGRIECDCKVLGKKVYAVPATCNVDIVLTLPTNHAACTAGNNDGTLIAPNGAISSTPIVQIAKAYAKFLKENFLRVRGAAVGVAPYSAKISVPPNRTDWTVPIPPMNQLPNKPYIKQAVAYGTDGHEGGEIVSSSTDIQYDWGNADGDDTDASADPNVGFPIMFRRGSTESYRGCSFGGGTGLTSTANPNSDALKFQRMNPQPCYLGHCNLLASCCEKNCPAYMANPYFITELTDDIGSVIYDLGLIRPINDTHNKSNFLFLAVQWAQMLLFESWTAHPAAAVVDNQKFAHPARSAKKKAIILIVNAPDRFEPQELTYLFFVTRGSEKDSCNCFAEFFCITTEALINVASYRWVVPPAVKEKIMEEREKTYIALTPAVESRC